MRVRDLAWGIVAWPAAGACWPLLVVREWDMPPESVIGVLLGTAAGFAAVGAVLWLPCSLLLSERVRTLTAPARGASFACLGFVIGLVGGSALALASGNAVWPESVSTAVQLACAASAASLLAWMLASALATRNVSAKKSISG